VGASSTPAGSALESALSARHEFGCRPSPQHLRVFSPELCSLSYADLRRDGWSRRGIETALATGRLVRVRKGTYLVGTCPDPVRDALAQGGRLDCLSLLTLLGVFVLECPRLHLQMDHGTTRVAERARAGVVQHWRDTTAPARQAVADLVEALAQACRCQTPRAALATLDNAWHLGLVDEFAIAAVFQILPRRFAALRPLLDRRSESGAETLVRLLLRALGCEIQVQVAIAGVGRVDLLVDGWLIIECDSKAHHEGWLKQRDDRRRDAAAAALGYTTLRVLAEDAFYAPERVRDAVRGLREARASGAHSVANRAEAGARNRGIAQTPAE
jgi:very-short-patch-repair endonuclease